MNDQNLTKLISYAKQNSNCKIKPHLIGEFISSGCEGSIYKYAKHRILKVFRTTHDDLTLTQFKSRMRFLIKKKNKNVSKIYDYGGFSFTEHNYYGIKETRYVYWYIAERCAKQVKEDFDIESLNCELKKNGLKCIDLLPSNIMLNKNNVPKVIDLTSVINKRNITIWG